MIHQKPKKIHVLINNYLARSKNPSYMTLVRIIINKRKPKNTKKKQIK